MGLFSLEGKNIVVIGGTSGLGLASAKAFVDNGAFVIVVGRDDETIGQAKTALGTRATVMAGDATRSETIEMALQAFTSSGQRVHGLFHVAGGSGRGFGDGPLHEITIEGWNKTLELNLTSVMLSNRAMVTYFLKHKFSGTILNMGSVLGYSPSPKYFVTHTYAAAKAAIIGFSQSIASYYAPHDIRINVVAPSLYDTPMSARATNNENIMKFIKTKQPLGGGRPGYPDDVAGAACYFMSDASSFTTGQVLSIDGGWHLSEGQHREDEK
jgi:NAD(P)-dependent dehydrogenase (short-subunit alcohol dehydrogenase family)